MTESNDASVLRRITGAAQTHVKRRVLTVAGAFRESLVKAAEDVLALEITGLASEERTLPRDDALALLPENALYLLLSDPEGSFGLMVLSPAMLCTLIEIRTMGRATSAAPAARMPTRTDAAVVQGYVEASLRLFDAPLGGIAGSSWAQRYHYSDFIEKPRTAGLILPSADFRVLETGLDLADGAREGQVWLILPAERRRSGDVVSRAIAAATEWQTKMTSVVAETPVALKAVMWRTKRPLSGVQAMKPGDMIRVPMRALERLTLEGIDGKVVAHARLGQAGGMKALRLDTAPGGDDAGTEDGWAGVQAPMGARGPARPVPTPAAPMALDLPDTDDPAPEGLGDLGDLGDLASLGGLPDLPDGDADDGAEGLADLGDLADLGSLGDGLPPIEE